MDKKVIARRAYNRALAIAEPTLRPHNARVTFLIGSGRSGTTALLEALTRGLHGVSIFEPFLPRQARAVDRVLPSHSYPRLEPSSSSPDMERLMSELFDGRHLTRWSMKMTSGRDLRRTSEMVLKEVRANRIAGWVERRFPRVRIRLMVRHPVAVVSSMLNVGWSDLNWGQIVPPAARALGVLPGELASERTPQSRWLAALWIADTVTAVNELERNTLRQAVHYEDLVTEPERVMERESALHSRFDIDAALASLQRPSRHASHDYSGILRTDLLTSRERADIGGLLRDFGMDMYSVDEPMPVRRLTAD